MLFTTRIHLIVNDFKGSKSALTPQTKVLQSQHSVMHPSVSSMNQHGTTQYAIIGNQF